MVSSVTSSDTLSQLLSQWNVASTSSTSSTSTTSSSSSSDTSSTSSSGSVATLSESDLLTAFQQLAQSLQATLLQAQSVDSGAQQSSQAGPQDFSQMFRQLDSNGDGSVTESEFVAGRPPGTSSDQATSLWNQIDSSGASSLDESDFDSAMQSLGPPGQSSTSSTTSDSSTTSSTTTPTVLQDLQSALVSYQAATASMEKALMASSSLSLSA